MTPMREAESGRIVTLDALRGIALFGILFVNLFSFGSGHLHPAPSSRRLSTFQHEQ